MKISKVKRLLKRQLKSELKRHPILNMAISYIPSYFSGLRSKKLFDEIKTYCVFIGHPRSGHSLVGVLIDAHPDAIISYELNALKYVKAGFSREQIYSMIIERSKAFAEEGRKRDRYLYIVPNQWQGRYRKLLVIGDKKGAGSATKLGIDTTLFDKLQKIININIKFIHVIRNPYDTISSICKRYSDRKRKEPDVRKIINKYYLRCEHIMNLKKQIDTSALLDIRHESIIASPEESITKICNFLGLEVLEDYVKDCASIIFTKPHKSRYELEWTDELIDIVKNRMTEFSFLQGYSFEE
ncbi:MAG: sulfotransferase [Nitrospirae bacterium]|nr:sulfotransferase [Nitrospirota bacterium]